MKSPEERAKMSTDALEKKLTKIKLGRH